jgi:hypothetical protein
MIVQDIMLLEKRGGKSGTFLHRGRKSPHPKTRRRAA